MSLFYMCWMLSGRSFCDELITRPESPVGCGMSGRDHEASIIRIRRSRAVLLWWKQNTARRSKYEGWNFNSGYYLFTTDTK